MFRWNAAVFLKKSSEEINQSVQAIKLDQLDSLQIKVLKEIDSELKKISHEIQFIAWSLIKMLACIMGSSERINQSFQIIKQDHVDMFQIKALKEMDRELKNTSQKIQFIAWGLKEEQKFN